jgi:hypothetical protein
MLRFSAVLSVIALAVVLEFLQHRIYGKSLEWWDIRDDSYAALAAWLLASVPAIRRTMLRGAGPDSPPSTASAPDQVACPPQQ